MLKLYLSHIFLVKDRCVNLYVRCLPFTYYMSVQMYKNSFENTTVQCKRIQTQMRHLKKKQKTLGWGKSSIFYIQSLLQSRPPNQEEKIQVIALGNRADGKNK